MSRLKLSEYTYRRIGCGLELEHVPSGKTRWLQGDDADQLEDSLDRVWKKAQNKKIGWNRATSLVDHEIDQYFD